MRFQRSRRAPVLPTLIAPILLCSAALAVTQAKPPAQPASWKPGAEGKAAASGPAAVVRDFVWGQTLEPAEGVFRLHAVDNTWADSIRTEDQLSECVARVTVPAEKAEYLIRVSRLVPWDHKRPTLGGVLVNHDMFGDTEIGGPGMFPRLRAYVSVWGFADVYKNGELIAKNRRALAWVGQAARDEQGKWLFEADPKRVTAHIVVFGTLGHGTRLPNTRDGFLHFEWPDAKVVVPGFEHDSKMGPRMDMAGAKNTPANADQ